MSASAYRHAAKGALASALLLFLSGCAFDILHEKQIPTSFEAVTANARTVTLTAEARIPIQGTTYRTTLKQGTRWTQVGRIPEGDVFATADQVVTVEGSNIHEAQLVISGNSAVGFYLPVEKAFSPAQEPVPLQLSTTN
jgi:hypothetical protein